MVARSEAFRMDTPKPMLVREVARIDAPRFVSGQVAGQRVRWCSARTAEIAPPSKAGLSHVTKNSVIPTGAERSEAKWSACAGVLRELRK